MTTNNQESIDKEITALYANMTMIQNMVNYSILAVPEENKNVTILPHEEVHQKFFNILLVDFLSASKNEVLGLRKLKYTGRNHGYLSYLFDICNFPQLNNNKGYKYLKKAIRKFIKWLNEVSVVENVWFPSIETEVTLNISRIQFLKICGDISKHGFLRLDIRIGNLIDIFENHSIPISKDQAYLILPEFYQWYHDSIFNYHLSTIAEFLNNINWAIYEYVKPFRDKSFILDSDTRPLIKHLYNELAGFKPYVPKFYTTKFLKIRY